MAAVALRGPLTGPLLMAFAVACVSVDTLIVRVLAREIHPFEIVFFRNLFGIAVIVPFLAQGGLGKLATPRMPLHVARAGLKLIGLALMFYAITLLPLSLVTAIGFTMPLFVCIGSMLILGERARWVRFLALGIGFAGVLVAVRPGYAPVGLGVGLALGSAVSIAGVMLMMKFLSVREPPKVVVTLNLLLTIPLALPFALAVWTTPSAPMLGLMVLGGLLGGLSQMAVSTAMSFTDASVLAPLEFLRLPLVAALAFAVFGEVTTLPVMIGGTMIFAGTLVLVFGDRRAVVAVP